MHWLLFHIAVFLCLTNAVIAEDLSFKFIYEEYKKGNYESVARLSLKSLKSPAQPKDPRMLFLYVSTEKDWGSLKSSISSISNPAWKESNFYWNAIYLFMERALVFGDSELLVKYGNMFQKEGKTNPRYLEAVFLLAYSLFDLKNTSEASHILEDLEKQTLSSKLQNQISELKSEIKNAGGR